MDDKIVVHAVGEVNQLGESPSPIRDARIINTALAENLIVTN